MSPSTRRTRIPRTLVVLVLAWGPPVVALWLLAGAMVTPPLAYLVAIAGAVAAAAWVVWSRRAVERPKALRAEPASGATPWDRVADPRGNYANRWASYQDLSEWLAARDWRGKKVAEFGHTNEVLRTFIRGAEYELLAYPEHDLQDLNRVAADRFDLAILDQTIEHVPDPERAVREVRRILKSGGVAIVSTPFLVPLHGTQDYGDYTRWTPQGMATMLARNGFEADVRWWGNLAATRALIERMYLRADEAAARGLAITRAGNEENYPVTVWALATKR